MTAKAVKDLFDIDRAQVLLPFTETGPNNGGAHHWEPATPTQPPDIGDHPDFEHLKGTDGTLLLPDYDIVSRY
jgi:hypothetical protein